MSDEKNKIEKSTLYLVATPIGNLSDISDRAITVLTEADFIDAEDTRNSLRLLSALGIKNELVSYHEHNKKASGDRLLARLLSGESCALITDAGMPAISDPGEDIVAMCAEAGIKVSVIPGACAAVSALSVSGLGTSKFAVEGFLSASKGDRQRRLEKVKNEERTLIFYEAPHKLKATLSDMCEIFGKERKISLCRELTKLNEEIQRTTLGEATAYYSSHEPRGEYVLVVEGFTGVTIDDETQGLLLLSPEEHVEHYVMNGLSKMDATKKAAKDRGMSKSDLYKILNTD